MLEKLIKNFVAYMGVVSELELDADGSYVLPISDLVRLRVRQNADEEIIISAFLGEIPASMDIEKAYTRMMEGNLFGQETGGAALGLDSDVHAVLIRRVPGDVSQEDFANYIESVLNYAEAWLEDLGLSTTEQE